MSLPEELTWGPTYYGPGFYTPNLLQYSGERVFKATFFIVGSSALSFPALLQAEHKSQHQIVVRTWDHVVITTLSDELG